MRWMLLLLLALSFGAADARVVFIRERAPATTYVGPLDVVGGATYWVGLRAATAANAAANAKIASIVRNSDSTACDFGAATTGAFGVVLSTPVCGHTGESLSTFCNSTTCFVAEFYDQSGNNNHFSASGGVGPNITISCNGTGKPCVAWAGTNYYANSSIGPASAATASVVWNKTFTSANCRTIAFAPVSVSDSAANQISIYSSSSFTATMSDGTLHALQAVGGTSAVANVDGTETTGNSGAFSGSAMGALIGNSSGLGCGSEFPFANFFEEGMWFSAFSSANRTAMCRNEQAFYGAVNFGAAC